jgi:hypothetical protein
MIVRRPISSAPARPSWPRGDGDVVPIGDPDEDEGYGDDDEDDDDEEEEDDEEPWQVKEPMSPSHDPRGFLVILRACGDPVSTRAVGSRRAQVRVTAGFPHSRE